MSYGMHCMDGSVQETVVEKGHNTSPRRDIRVLMLAC